jgi:hypothetical protein
MLWLIVTANVIPVPLILVTVMKEVISFSETSVPAEFVMVMKLVLISLEFEV